VVYRNTGYRKFQYFINTSWPGGLYASPSISGTRPGGAIAGSWAVLNYLGKEGYKDYAAKTLAATKKIQEAINATEGLKVVGNPLTTVFSFTGSGKIDIYRLGDELSALGWHLDRQLTPPSLHLTVSYGNVAYADEFIRDLDIAVKRLAENSIENIGDGIKQGLVKQAARLLPESLIKKLTEGSIKQIPNETGSAGKTAPLYGLMGELSGSGTLADMVTELLDAMNKPSKNDQQEK
jgi:glutamate/tyrosine decarboxylase-like PLP-dependent enzyme